MVQTPSMSRLIEQLSRLPGIGEKTASRLAFHILRTEREYAQALAEALLAAKDDTRLCSVCFALTESDPCPLCADPRRAADAICVVEEPADLLAIERARGFRGRYHVLHGRRLRARRRADRAGRRQQPDPGGAVRLPHAQRAVNISRRAPT